MNKKLAWRAYLVALHMAVLLVAAVVAYRHPPAMFQRHQSVLNDRTYLARRDLLHEAVAQPGATVFLGDSLTAGGEWASLLGSPRVLNFGIGGDNTAALLQRLTDVSRHRPEKIMLMIGVNDLRRGSKPEAVIENYRRIVQRIRAESPSTLVVIQSVLPTDREELNAAIVALNADLRTLSSQQGLEYLDLHDTFADASGKLDARYSLDGVHLTAAGYVQWRDRLSKNATAPAQ